MVTGLRAEDMLPVEAANVVGGHITSGQLILERFDESTFETGAYVGGPTGPTGPTGIAGETGLIGNAPQGATGTIGPTGPTGTGVAYSDVIYLDDSDFTYNPDLDYNTRTLSPLFEGKLLVVNCTVTYGVFIVGPPSLDAITVGSIINFVQIGNWGIGVGGDNPDGAIKSLNSYLASDSYYARLKLEKFSTTEYYLSGDLQEFLLAG